MAKKFQVINGSTSKEPMIKSGDYDNQSAIQDFNNHQVYTKGFSFGVDPGPSNEFTPVLGGKARRIHGIIILYPTVNFPDDDMISLLINSETVIDKVNWKAYNPNPTSGNAFKPKQFYELPRALSGQDSVTLTVNAVNSHQLYITFYLSNA